MEHLNSVCYLSARLRSNYYIAILEQTLVRAPSSGLDNSRHCVHMKRCSIPEDIY